MAEQSEPGNGRPDPQLSQIIDERRQLINVAYRLLGSASTYSRPVLGASALYDAGAAPRKRSVGETCRNLRHG